MKHQVLADVAESFMDRLWSEEPTAEEIDIFKSRDDWRKALGKASLFALLVQIKKELSNNALDCG